MDSVGFIFVACWVYHFVHVTQPYLELDIVQQIRSYFCSAIYCFVRLTEFLWFRILPNKFQAAH